MSLVSFWIVWCNLPIAPPCSSINIMTQRLSEYLFAGPLPIFETSTAKHFFAKTSNNFILPFAKGLHESLCLRRNENDFVMEGMIGWILILTSRFIPNNFKKLIIKYHNSSIKNTLKLCFVCELCSVEKQIIDKKFTKLCSIFILSRVGGTPP